MKPGNWLLYGALLAVFVLHNDWWWWDDASFVFGLPIGLVYQALLMAVTSVVMFLLVRHAWPAHLEIDDEEPRS